MRRRERRQQRRRWLAAARRSPYYGRRGRGKKIQNGLTIAIEPMINMGTEKVETLDDKWTIVTADRQPSAHFEHNVAVVDGASVILSTFDFIYEALGL